MPLSELAGFLAIVALATYCQNLTGFAFSLILLGLAGATGILSIAEAANTATLLSLVNAITYLSTNRVRPRWDLVRPALLSHVPAVLAGAALMVVLDGDALNLLRVLLGVCILGSAGLLAWRRDARTTPSPHWSLHLSSITGGLMGGLFAVPGPPVVYFFYRQPLSVADIRACLFTIFAATVLTRLTLMTATGNIGMSSVVTAATAVPVIWIVTWLGRRFPPRMPRSTLQYLVCALIALSGVALLLSGLR